MNKFNIRVTNILGLQVQFGIQDNQIDLSLCPAGLYAIEIIGEGGKRYLSKVIKI